MSSHSAATADLRYNQVAIKASHNSYERNERPVVTQLPFSQAHPHQAGCRGLELDLHLSGDQWEWSVAHVGGYDGSASKQFRAYLRVLRQWSRKEGRHDVITVYLDLKSRPHDLRSFGYYLDAYIEEFMDRDRMFAPPDLQGDADSLVAGASAKGWPTLEELRGRFIFCLSGHEDAKAAYSRARGRLCFADKKLSFDDARNRKPSTTEGDRVFFNFNLDPAQDWKAPLRWFHEQPGFVTRGYTLNDSLIWKKALGWKVNLLATDKVRNHDWATVGPEPFRKL